MKRRWEQILGAAAGEADEQEEQEDLQQPGPIRRRAQQLKEARPGKRRGHDDDDGNDPQAAGPQGGGKRARRAERGLTDLPPQVLARLPGTATLARAARQHAASARQREDRQVERSAARQHTERAARLRAAEAAGAITNMSAHYVDEPALGPRTSTVRANQALLWALVTPGAGAMARRLVDQLSAPGMPLPSPGSWDPIEMSRPGRWSARDCVCFERWLRTLEEEPFASACCICQTDDPGRVVRHACGHCMHLECYEAWRRVQCEERGEACCPLCRHVVAGASSYPAYALAHGTHNVLDVGPHVEEPRVEATRALMTRAPERRPPEGPATYLSIELMLGRAVRLNGVNIVRFILQERPSIVAPPTMVLNAVQWSAQSLAALLPHARGLSEESAASLVRTVFATGDVGSIAVLMGDARFVPTLGNFHALLHRASWVGNGEADPPPHTIRQVERLVLPAATTGSSGPMLIGNALLTVTTPRLFRTNQWLTPRVLQALEEGARMPAASEEFARDWWQHVVWEITRGDADGAAGAMTARLMRRGYVPPDHILQLAVDRGNLQAASALVQAGARPSWLMVRVAGNQNHRAIVHLLLDHLEPAEIEIALRPTDTDGFTALFDSGSATIVRMFLASWRGR